MSDKPVQIEDSWYQMLKPCFEKPYFKDIKTQLKSLKLSNTTIYPKGKDIFKAFELTPFDKVKVVILGQDPYHQPGQAMGLSFSVPKGVKVPPSLVNIYKEIHRDLGHPIPSHGDLSSWALQGVFLLNAILTVEKGKPGSHRNIGWQTFTDEVISILSQHKKNLVFLLWGNFAREKKKLINHQHMILESSHPSPLAGNQFFGNGHFSKCNDFLKSHGIEPISWSIN